MSSRIKEILSSVQFKVKFISVAPNMDLVLIVSESEEVLAYRFIQNWVKVWACSRTHSQTAATKSSIIGVAWEPAGKYCVVGHADGTLAYCDVESGAIFVRIELDLAKYEETSLSSLKFSSSGNDSSNSLHTSDYYDSLLAPGDLIPKYPATCLSDDQQVVFRALQRHLLDASEQSRTLSFLICFGQKLNIYLLSSGFVLLAVIQLGSELSPLPLINCLAFDCKSPFGDLAAVCEYKMRNIKSFCFYRLASQLMTSNHTHINFLARSLTDFIGCQEMAKLIIEHLAEGLESVLFEFTSKIETLATSKKTANSGLVSTDFIQLLLLGRCSVETEQFFVLNIGERGLQRLTNSLQKNFGGLLKQAISMLAAIADRMVLVASRIMSLLKYEQGRLGDLTMNPNLASAIYRSALQFRLKIAQLHSIAQQDVGQLGSFVKFLHFQMNYLSAKQQRDSSMASQRADGTKDLTPLTSDEIKSVISFINRNFVEDYENGKCAIKFERISQFFSSPAPISSNGEIVGCLTDNDMIMQNPWVSFMLDIETTPMGSNADVAADLENILPGSDLELSLVQSLMSFSGSLKNFIAAMIVALTASYNVDWCAKLPISNLGDCAISSDGSLPVAGAFVDRDSGQLVVLRVDRQAREGRVEFVGFARKDFEDLPLKVTRILPAQSNSVPLSLGLYVVVENSQNGENFGQMFGFTDAILAEQVDRTTFKKLDAVPAAILQPPTTLNKLFVDDAKIISFGRLHASDMLYIANTGRSLIILQPGFQLLRAFPGIEQS